MRTVRILYIAALLGVGIPPTDALAQRRVPDTHMMAAGGEIGFFVPDDEFGTAFIFGGLFEYYVTPRLGLRASLSRTDPEFDRGTDDRLTQRRLGFDVIYNWERGKWHPFAGGGLGVHVLDIREDDRTIADDTDVGFNVLGGVEYFFDRRTTLKFEGRIQLINEFLGAEPSGVAVTFGLKRYF